MKHTKLIQVPVTTRTIIYAVTCDLCGMEIKLEEEYTVNEVEVRHKVGSNYPEGGSGEETSVDMCGKCFDEKLIPWLISQGAKPNTEDWDW